MIRPWEEEPERYSYAVRWGGVANCVNEPIEDARTGWKRGDIVKFGTGYFGSYDYKDWFLNDKDKVQMLRRDKRVPRYAANQYAVLMTRYRVMKHKYGTVYRDYGSSIMFITGSKIGKIRRFYSTNPFERVASFPYKQDDDEVTNILTDLNIIDLANTLYSTYGNTPTSRTSFVEILQHKISEVHT